MPKRLALPHKEALGDTLTVAKRIGALVGVCCLVFLGACSSRVLTAASTTRATSSTASSTRTAVSSPPANTLPGGEGLPQGAQVTSVVQYQGKWVAAGADFPGGAKPVASTCATRGCNPVVWTSPNRSQWTAVWECTANGSIPGDQLVVGSGKLLLFLSDEATHLWSTTDAIDWTPVDVPEAMMALPVTKAVYGNGRFGGCPGACGK